MNDYHYSYARAATNSINSIDLAAVAVQRALTLHPKIGYSPPTKLSLLVYGE